MPDSKSAEILLGDLARQLDIRLDGDATLAVRSVASLKSATAHDICFLQSPKYLKQLQHSDCGAVIVPDDFKQSIKGKSLLYASNPHLVFVRVIHLLNGIKSDLKAASIHPSAQVDSTASIDTNVSIGANCVIGGEVKISEGVTIGPGSVIEQRCEIGANSRIHPRATICHDVLIGKDVIIHPGVVLGSDGFGLVYDQGSWVKIPHLGTVVVGDEVEIGANTTVDRGALDDTVIEKGVKLDNLIQVAHNVIIGENTAIAACVGIAGSAIIGKNCKISGAAVVLGHLTIADNVTITAMSLVTKSIHKSGTYSSGTPLMENRLWHRNNARYKSLDKLAKSVSSLEKK